MLTLPHNLISSSSNVQAELEFHENGRRQSFGEDIRILGCRRDVQDTDVAKCDVLTYKVEINLYMLCPLMLDGVGGEVHSTDIVTVDHCSTT
jgi:hypothetical protein